MTAHAPLSIVILAAGLGTRMRSRLAKVLHPLAGKPLLAHVLDAARSLQPDRLVVVVGHQAAAIQQTLAAPDLQWVVQDPPLGTGHALATAMAHVPEKNGEVLVLNGDVPLMPPAALQELLAMHRQADHGVSVLTMVLPDPTGYGRLVRDAHGLPTAIVEEKDATPAIRPIAEVNTGTYCFALSRLADWLSGLGTDNAQGEFYLTDVVALCRQSGGTVGALPYADVAVLSGVNSRQHLARLEQVFRDRLAARLMDEGVTFQDPGSCWLAADVVIGRDTEILAHVVLGPGVVIGENCRIGPFCDIRQSRIGDGCRVLAFSHLEGASLAGRNEVGPFVRLRPAASLEEQAKVGNFCEIKKSRIGRGSKINHLSYVGDALVGEQVNVGAGTITCNYDGFHKHQTIIEDGVFIGSDSQLVAPVRVGARAVVAAGTTVTAEVPADALAIARTPQRHVPEWTRRRRSRST